MKNSVLLLISVFVIATCGLIYELVAGTLASYLLGDSITQFSTIIGLYLFSMGIGSFLSKFVKGNLLSKFIQIEFLIGFLGGVSSGLLFYLFNYVDSFRIILYALVAITGTLVGIEIPLIMRILKDNFKFNDLISNVFTFDYIGALLASLIFPLILVPYLGLIKTSLLFGVLNVSVGLVLCFSLDKAHVWVNKLKAIGMAVVLLLIVGFAFSDALTQHNEEVFLGEKIIIARSSPYQRVIVTSNKGRFRLYLNGNLQFSSDDEYRYHEALVHPPFRFNSDINRVLVLGGGDGMAVRELLKYKQISSIQLVDLDPVMLKLFKENSLLAKLNQHALSDKRLKVYNDDAMKWVAICKDSFDLICVDFPDPGNYAIGKLYTNTFYKSIQPLLKSKGLMVVQSTSPFFAPKSFWCVEHTIQSVGFNTLPYHIYLPSFGEWGFVMASKQSILNHSGHFADGLKFINDETFQTATVFPADMKADKVDVNRLDNQVLVNYFEDEWGKIQ